jgi:hypothetical protein
LQLRKIAKFRARASNDDYRIDYFPDFLLILLGFALSQWFRYERGFWDSLGLAIAGSFPRDIDARMSLPMGLWQ